MLGKILKQPFLGLNIKVFNIAPIICLTNLSLRAYKSMNIQIQMGLKWIYNLLCSSSLISYKKKVTIKRFNMISRKNV